MNSALLGVPLKEIPECIVGNQVVSRAAEEERVGGAAGPGVAAAVDDVQHHFRIVAAGAIDAADDVCAIVHEGR